MPPTVRENSFKSVPTSTAIANVAVPETLVVTFPDIVKSVVFLKYLTQCGISKKYFLFHLLILYIDN